MSTANNGGPAFPATTDNGCNTGVPGMALRDYFAAKAMQAILSDGSWGHTCKTAAKTAYEQADAMLEARK